MSPEPTEGNERTEPMLARDSRSLPSGEGWAYEIKWDGIRAITTTDGEGGLTIRSRSGARQDQRYPELGTNMPAPLRARRATLDAEIVAIDGDGRPDFQLLQRRIGLSDPILIQRRMRETPVSLIAFDLMALDGEDLTGLGYLERRERLDQLGIASGDWQVPRHHVGDGEALLEAARRQRLEGVVAKRTASPYEQGRRTGAWVKVRLKRRQDFLIGGWLPGHGGRAKRLGSLMLGVWDAGAEAAAGSGRAQSLVYAGKVGSGLTEAMIDRLGELLAPLEQTENPFESGIGPKRDDPRWCRPELVCSVEFSEWTREATLRQPAFKGLRDDVDPAEVVREGDA